MQKGHLKRHKREPCKTKRLHLPIPIIHSSPLRTSLIAMMFYSNDATDSVGEWGAYQNAILADEAHRARISSPTNTRTMVEETTTPPPIMIPSADMIREMAEDRFLDFTEQVTVIEEVEEPINYQRVAEQPTDDDLGLPFFPNKPSSFQYYPLLICTDNSYHATQVVAPYIYYCNRGQEVVRTMGCNQPLYAAPVYLSTPNPTHLPIPLTNSQLLQFSNENPWAYAIDETLRRLEDLHIDAEVSRLHEKLELQIKIEKQLNNLRQQETRLWGARFDVEQTIAAIQDQMERVGLYQTLTDAYASMITGPTRSPSDAPLGLWARGPLEMPRLNNTPHSSCCWQCDSPNHKWRRCPQHMGPKKCNWCGSYMHWSNKCLFKRLKIEVPHGECTVAEALEQKENIPTWCGKCLRNNPRHEEVDCPTHEQCRACRRRGPLGFMRAHRCLPVDDEDPINEEVDIELYRDRES